MGDSVCPHVNVDVQPETLENDFDKVIRKIKPDWKKENVIYEQSGMGVTRGMINTMVKCYEKKNPIDAIMIRIHNTIVINMLDRDSTTEAICIKYFMEKSCAPKILATFNTGFCYEFIHGQMLNNRQLGEEPIWRLIATDLAKFHSGTVEDGKTLNRSNTQSALENLIEKLWQAYPSEMADPEKNEFFKREFMSKEKLQREVNMLLQHYKQLDSPMVLCHNDTRAENIIYDADKVAIHFVDFEAMNYTYQAGELSAHFQRFCGFNPEPDYTLYPSEEFQLKWLRYYLEKYNQFTGRKEEVTDKDVRKLQVQVKKFHLLNLLIAGLGGPAMEAMNFVKTDDINWLELSLGCIKEYFKEKEEILNLKMPD